MAFVFPILLGLIQGIAEFLPISSSGHLALFQAFFGSGLPGGVTAVSTALHFGTLCAVLAVYRKDIFALIPAFFTGAGKAVGAGKNRLSVCGKEERTALLLFFGTLPLGSCAALEALLLKCAGRGFVSLLDEKIACRPAAVGALLMLNGLLLFLAGRWARGQKPLDAFSAGSAFGVGVFQVFALLPGLSRSGMTIAGGRLLGLSREESVRFSFLLSAPAACGALVKELPDLISSGALSGENALPLLCGVAVSFAAGIACIAFLRRRAQRASFGPFAAYCAAVGAAALCASGLTG